MAIDGRKPRLFPDQFKLSSVDFYSARSFELVIGLLHLWDVVEPADDVGGTERLAGVNMPAVHLLDHADVAALVAPGFAHFGRVQRHAGQPWAGLVTKRHLIGTDHPLRDRIVVALI